MIQQSKSASQLFMLLLSLMISIPSIAKEEVLWRQVAPANTVVMDLDEGRVVIELNPVFAPHTVAQFKRLVRKGFYDGQSFYRVIDGFVAQGGDGSDMGEANSEPTLKAEFEQPWSDKLSFVSVQHGDLFAPETGFIDGFAVARDMDSKKVWLTHCPGTVGMARLNDPDTGSTDFYIVIGQAPRYLDRIITVFGRVIYGMNLVQRIRRAPAESDGMIADPALRSTIKSMKIAEDMKAEDRLLVEVMDTKSKGFKDLLDARRKREHEFFFRKPPPVLDVCQVPNNGRPGSTDR
jgi:cyclophilin family peptidyl-prolyl cis-trans isomerase